MEKAVSIFSTISIGDDSKGLTQKEVEERWKTEGYNELPSQKPQSIWGLIFNVLKEPMLLLLLGSGFIYLLLGETKDALMLLSFVFVVIGITIYQEQKSEKALEALRHLSSPRALVIRDGERVRISGREVVRNDLLVLREGDRVPADAVVLSSTNLTIDESLLTGESLPVRKAAGGGNLKASRPGGHDLPFVYSGTLVVQGHGLARVTSIGVATEMGRIGKALETITQEDTLLKKETGKIVSKFAIFGIGLCLIIVILLGLTTGNWLQGFLAGLTLSMAMLPEEFSVVLVIFFTLGAWRMSKRQVLTRRLPAIEALGAATVLCVDKTGTLTLNKMQLVTLLGKKEIDLEKTQSNLPEDFHSLLEYAVLASQKDAFDPLEKEIKRVGYKYLANSPHLHHNWKLVREYPLIKQLLALSHVWQSPDKKDYVIAAKGAPEAIFDLCHLNEKRKQELTKQMTYLANKGLRVLGVAKTIFSHKDLPSKQHDFDFKFVGLLGFVDPIRSDVPQAITEAQTAGIRVVMITGDYPGTAYTIGKQIGLANPEAIITGPEIEKMNHLELREKVKHVSIFARVVPEQKLAIVNAFKANGDVVTMTGDGVNDAPALKSANIGIAMGDRGTDVAREAAAIVLLNDDFSAIVNAVKLGRRIFDNLKKAMSYILAVHVPIAGMSFLPVVLRMPTVLLPAHIAFLELIIDPACSVVFESEPEENDIMKRLPRNLHEGLFNKKTFLISLLQGLSSLLVVFSIFLYAVSTGKGDDQARTLAFTTLVLTNLLLILTNLSWKKNLLKIIFSTNQALKWILAGATVSLSLVLYLPFLRNLFHFSFLHMDDLLIVGIGSFISLAWFEIFKFIRQ